MWSDDRRPGGRRWKDRFFLMTAPRRALATAIAIATLTAVSTAPARAWNATGHMTIGAIAETRLSPAAKAEIAKLLPLVAHDGTPDFMTAGVWMDEIRADGVRAYDRWHYHNLAHSPDGTPVPAAAHEDNVSWAIEQNLAVLKSEKASDPEKARALRFLIHTVQDVHNPLHCGSRYTKDNTDGDAGGNEFRFEAEAENGPRNLHALWDGALGTFARGQGPLTEQAKPLRTLAEQLTAKYPESSLPQSKTLDPNAWAQEGAEMLKGTVYPEKAGRPDAAYIEKHRPVAERQATLAGYRLANLLNSIWSGEKAPATPAAPTAK